MLEPVEFKQHTSQSTAKMEFWLQDQGKGLRKSARDYFLNAVRMVCFIKCCQQFIFDQHISGSRMQVITPPAGLSGLLIILIHNSSSCGLHMELLHGCYLWSILECHLKRVQIRIRGCSSGFPKPFPFFIVAPLHE